MFYGYLHVKSVVVCGALRGFSRRLKIRVLITEKILTQIMSDRRCSELCLKVQDALADVQIC